MGGLIALFFVVIMLYGLVKAHTAFLRLFGVEYTSTSTKDKKTSHGFSKAATDTKDKGDPRVDTFVLAIKNAGYLGRTPVTDKERVKDPVLSEMARELSESLDLKWVLPEKGLGLTRVNEDGYKWGIVTPTHLILF